MLTAKLRIIALWARLVDALGLICLAGKWPGACLELIWIEPWVIACTRRAKSVAWCCFVCLACNQVRCDGLLLL